MDFDPTAYGEAVARILAMDGNGKQLAPLICGPCTSEEARQAISQHKSVELFRGAADPTAALAGLWLYFSCFEEAHKLIDHPKSTDATFWHAILHRREPDPGNSAYWYRKLGPHPIFKPLADEAGLILRRHPQAQFRVEKWDPFAFVTFCERARSQPGTEQELAAREIQLAEWQLLFDHCARPR